MPKKYVLAVEILFAFRLFTFSTYISSDETEEFPKNKKSYKYKKIPGTSEGFLRFYYYSISRIFQRRLEVLPTFSKYSKPMSFRKLVNFKAILFIWRTGASVDLCD